VRYKNKPAIVYKKFGEEKKNVSRVPDIRLTPRQTGRLTDGRKVTKKVFSLCVYVVGDIMYLISKTLIATKSLLAL
jgi:hypothetical protein